MSDVHVHYHGTSRPADDARPSAETFYKSVPSGSLAATIEAAFDGHAAKIVAKSKDADPSAAMADVFKGSDGDTARLAFQMSALESARNDPPDFAFYKMREAGVTDSEIIAVRNWIARGLR